MTLRKKTLTATRKRKTAFVKRGSCPFFVLVIAAAAKHYYNGKDDNPGAVIVEKMAKAVVIHMCSPKKILCGLCRLFL